MYLSTSAFIVCLAAPKPLSLTTFIRLTMHSSSILFSLFGSALALTSPPPGALTVGGSEGKFSTVQAAVDALQNTTARQSIFIYSGTYEEQVYIAKHNGPISIYGQASDDSSYHTNTVTLSFGLSQAFNLSNDLTATLRAHSPDFNLYNVNVENTYGKGSQAVAVSAYGTEQAYYGCKLTGFQDTLLTQRGRHYFVNTYIEGKEVFLKLRKARSLTDMHRRHRLHFRPVFRGLV
ncbi:Pectinesterase catalytic [Macrophomina phaseolina MS6]|uniref:pectinesterase n=1 Tax=Macrophomina phaseolina (strain MS6) TaxID=1126212 RepID=K2SSP8_MACPH|nr:Pectinesterase catalytic [Macrophomina phaseolina MS6]